MAGRSTSARYSFGVFEFDAGTLELRKRGLLVRVRPQSLKLLALILSRAGELVSRDEIRDALWGGDTFVDFDQGVNHCINQLRGALGDDADSPRFVETLPRRGYRFIAPVTIHDPRQASDEAVHTGSVADPIERVVTSASESDGARRRPYLTRATILALSAAVIGLVLWLAVHPGLPVAGAEADALRVIQVVPFESSPDPAIGLGLAHEITNRLGRERGLTVRPVAGPRQTADAPLRLEGELSQDGDAVTMSARLVEPASGSVAWSQRFTFRAAEFFSVEDVIAERVSEALRLRAAAAQQGQLRRRYTNNAPAYTDYLRGRAAMAQYTPDGTRRAAEAFERALERDPEFTPARAGLAAAAADMYLRFAPAGDPEGWAERAEREARAALDMDPDLAEAHLARAAVARKREFDWETAIAASRRALVLNPTLDQAHFFIAAAYYHLGYMEEALLEMERGRRLGGPDTVEPLRIEALVALFSGRFAPAVAQLEEVSRRSSQPIGDTYLALGYYYSGNAARAEQMLESLSANPSASTASRAGTALAGVLAARGDAAGARRRLDEVLARQYRDHHVAYGLGAAYAQLGDADRAGQWLRTAADSGFPCLVWFERDPLLQPLRGSASFAELLAYVRSVRESVRSGGTRQ
ncbi:MAG TPA: winged helix-turn-helix domain-containing protein [Vicinamibacterales bacterium]|nr:winged helix-turn-helix domain-containing protein [Vicinamibacterales bacterium]